MAFVVKKKSADKIGAEKSVSMEAPEALPQGTSQKVAVATVDVKQPDGSETSKVEVVKEVSGNGPFASVEVSIGLTRNLGNYESLRFNIALTMPCHPNPQDINDAYAEAKGWVDSRVEMFNQEIDQQLGS